MLGNAGSAQVPDNPIQVPVPQSSTSAPQIPTPTPTVVSLPSGNITGPGGLSCQEWNARVAANPYLAQEVRPAIEGCPAS